MQYKKFGVFTSSVNPEEFSKTWEAFLKILGIIAGVSAAIPTISAIFPPSQAQEVIQAFTAIGASVAAIYQSGNLLFGLVRKFTVRS